MQETKQPAASTMLAIAYALGVTIDQIMIGGAGNAQSANPRAAAFVGLNSANRAILLVIAQALLDAQKLAK